MRPENAIIPGPGQESVWDYPRPPRLEPNDRLIRVECSGIVIAESRSTIRVLETSHPPVYYIPPEDVRVELLMPELHMTFCEWKGIARHYALKLNGKRIESAAWCYPEPEPGFEAIMTYIAFYPSKVDRCTVDGVDVIPQAGDFYGGWITPDIVGPFKGDPGTESW
ncbi:MAG: DUF427 domain-containing protein [Thermomicrobiales bacterium]